MKRLLLVLVAAIGVTAATSANAQTTTFGPHGDSWSDECRELLLEHTGAVLDHRVADGREIENDLRRHDCAFWWRGDPLS